MNKQELEQMVASGVASGLATYSAAAYAAGWRRREGSALYAGDRPEDPIIGYISYEGCRVLGDVVVETPPCAAGGQVWWRP